MNTTRVLLIILVGMMLAVGALAPAADDKAGAFGLRLDPARDYVGFIQTPLRLNNAEVALQLRFVPPSGAMDTIDTPEMLNTFGWPEDRRKLIGLAPPRVMTPDVKFEQELTRAVDSLKRLHLQPGMGKLVKPVDLKEPVEFTLPAPGVGGVPLIGANDGKQNPQVKGKYIDYQLSLVDGTVLTHRMFIFPLPLRINNKDGEILIRCSAIFFNRLGEPEDPQAVKDHFAAVEHSLATVSIKLVP